MTAETTTERGRRGEDRALAYLQAQGLVLLHRNFRCRGGELDLVMLDGRTLALIEVRLRSDPRYGGAAATVDARKQRRCILAARYLLLTHPQLRERPARFDVVAIGPGTDEITWIRQAFSTT